MQISPSQQIPKNIATTSTDLAATNNRTSILFTLKHQVGALAKALQVFQELGINVMHIELHSEGHEGEGELVSWNKKCRINQIRN